MLAALLSITVIAVPSLAIGPARTFSPALVTRPAIAPVSPVHLGLVFKLTHQDELEALLQGQQDPGSSDYRRWLTPAEFGRRFGQSAALIERTRAWLESNGFEVTTYPNRSFVEAIGTAEHVQRLLSIRLLGVVGKQAAVHVPESDPVLPAWIAKQVLHVAGLDTRPRFHHRMWDSYGFTSLGPQDLRVQYDVWPVLDAGFYGQGQDLIVLSEAEAPGKEVQAADIAYFYQNVSDANATFSENVLANPDGDYDSEGDGRLEFELDSEMQSVGSPGAKSIMLEVAPASQVFSLGVQDIVNNYPNATAISISLGLCETEVNAFAAKEVTAMRQAVQQGTAEGQTWSAASGDSGADDCEAGQAPATVDFPAVIPEIVAMGGSQIVPVTFDQNIALNSSQTEQVWNDFEAFGGGGAGGGGISTLFKAPAYQSSFGFMGRSVPDLSLIAGSPSVVAVTDKPGWFNPIDGTSVASPLSAGFFGLIASGLGCRLGDPHTVLYNLGAEQQDGGPVVFNDIVSGDNSANGVTGHAAATGYDSASGWGSMDVAALLRAWPACPADAGTTPGASGPSYSQCTFIGCDSGCLTLQQGPSTCSFVSCDPSSATNSCPLGDICTAEGPYAADGDGGTCYPGCLTDSDCIDGGVCDVCFGLDICVPTGTPTAHIGDPCESPDDCPAGGTCLLWTGYYDAGYCSAPCDPSSKDTACDCPAGSTCFGMTTQDGMPFNTCLGGCDDDGGCGRPGYVCQPEGSGPSSCQPACEANKFFDTCEIYSVSGTACDNLNGTCYPPTGTSSGGRPTGTSSGGRTSTGSSSGGRTSTGGHTSSGTTEGTSSGGSTTGSSTGTSTGSATGATSTTGNAVGTTSGGMIEVKAEGCTCSSGGSPDIALGALRPRRPDAPAESGSTGSIASAAGQRVANRNYRSWNRNVRRGEHHRVARRVVGPDGLTVALGCERHSVLLDHERGRVGSRAQPEPAQPLVRPQQIEEGRHPVAAGVQDRAARRRHQRAHMVGRVERPKAVIDVGDRHHPRIRFQRLNLPDRVLAGDGAHVIFTVAIDHHDRQVGVVAKESGVVARQQRGFEGLRQRLEELLVGQDGPGAARSLV